MGHLVRSRPDRNTPTICERYVTSSRWCAVSSQGFVEKQGVHLFKCDLTNKIINCQDIGSLNSHRRKYEHLKRINHCYEMACQ